MESEGSQSGTVRKWPKYPFLLSVRGPLIQTLLVCLLQE